MAQMPHDDLPAAVGRPATPADAAARCAPWARACTLRAGGSAVRAPGGVLLVEWPLPWPRDVREIPDLAPVLSAAAERHIRVLVVSSGQGEVTNHTVCLHARPGRLDEPFVRYACTETSRPREAVVSGALGLLAGAPGDVEPPATDVVVCTHGQRDICCGGAGTNLHAALAGRTAAGVRTWRSSHQGGHRFAPTALFLPDATSWAFLDVLTVLDILDRRCPVGDLVSRYRGLAAIGDPRVQALEGVAFAEIGWDWLSRARGGRVLGTGRVEVTGRAADGTLQWWDGIVGPGEGRIGPACGGPAGATSEYEELLVHAHRRRVRSSP